MKTKIQILFIAGLFFVLNSFSQTLVNASFMNQARVRTYSVYIPAIYNSSVSVPLVLNLHGYGSNNSQQMAYGDFRPIADTADFIIVCPNGTLDPSNTPYWNCFDVPGGPNDVTFISALIDTISAHYNIDPDRIYSTGMSNGGYMSYELASQLSYRLTAIASVAGDMLYGHMNACHPLHPFPIMQIHGTSDGTVAYSGDTYSEPIDTLVKFWVDFNHCNPTPTLTNLPDIDTSDMCTADHYVYSGGDSATTVEFYKINGGGHSWPGAPVNINITNMDFSASVEIWRFFRQYRLTQVSTGIHEQQPEMKIAVYPNPSNGNFTINFDHAEPRTISISNCLGQIVQVINCTGTSANIYLGNSGIYFITVCDREKIFSQKIIRN
ncbi:MAG TPA: T9SS type A sorting domain-containing protein [Bacteroidia bacterium]|nr:T9SS type A sorting domain-containing protein [Bacteroidia bacterium]